MRVLHILHLSLPQLCGYSIRTDCILQHQREFGMDVAGVTSAQHPSVPGNLIETVNGVDFYRTAPTKGFKPPILREWRLMRVLRRRALDAIRIYSPDIVHAHSPVIVGMPSLQAARKASLPFVYEVRDLWENASVDRGKFAENSVLYKIARRFESSVLNQADAVVTICEKLRNEIAPRVGSDKRLFVVGNGVNAHAFAPRDNGLEEKQRRNLVGKKVMGYIGTFQPYEGLDVLIASMPEVLRREANCHLIIAGSGGVESQLRKQVGDFNLDRFVTFTGRVPHEEVGELYAIMDLVVYPRIRTRTTILTTPLKPLEAMSMGKPVLVSDVEAMQELVQSDVTGAIFRAGDPVDLATQALKILQATEQERFLMGQRARSWILRERQWPMLVSKYAQIYDSATRHQKR